MNKNFIFSSESVGEGHPDKVCDSISDAVLDALLAGDPQSRVACETYAKSNIVIVGGEITSKAQIHINEIVRRTIGLAQGLDHLPRSAARQNRVPQFDKFLGHGQAKSPSTSCQDDYLRLMARHANYLKK